MSKILILHSSTDGHTVKICQTLAEEIKESEVTVAEISNSPELSHYDKVIIGASIYYGRHSRDVYRFIEQNIDILKEKKSAFFSVNLTARKPHRNTPQTNPYIKKFIRKIKWSPDLVSVFAGKVNYPAYKFTDKMMIRFIMFITKGPTDTSKVIEFTDWTKVKKFAHDFAKL